MILQTEYNFVLPKGYLRPDGTVCREGVMRLATAIDEIESMRDPRVKSNPDYASILLLARVVRMQGMNEMTPEEIEKLYTADFSFLQNMYETINSAEEPVIRVQCPHCGKSFTDTLDFTAGE